MPDQENYGRFTQGAWNFITLDEDKAMVYAVVRG